MEKFVIDESKSWQEKFKDLEIHHIKETESNNIEIENLKVKLKNSEELLLEYIHLYGPISFENFE